MESRVLAVMLLGACGGTYGGAPPAHPSPAVADRPHRGIEDAALPYTVLDAKTGHQVETNAFWTRLGAARAICVGEEHSNPHHHWVELEVVRRMMKQWPAASPRALGMEMFQRPFQGVVDDFAAGRIDEAALRSRAGWEDRWGYDFEFYRPTIAVAVAAHASLLALNAAKELTKKVAHHGLDALTPEERARLPADLDLKDKKHRAWFDALMSDMSGGNDPHDPHGGGSGSGGGSADLPSAEAIYTVQVIWDETMADTAAKWLQANRDGRIVILAGTGHCHDAAIVHRIERRGIGEVVSIRSVVDDGQGGVAEELARPMTDFLVVLDLPEVARKQLRDQNKDE